MHKLGQPLYKVVLVVSFCVSRRSIPHNPVPLLLKGQLERNGIVASEQAPPPVATSLFSLTSRGRQLEPVLHAIGGWGAALLGDPSGDAFHSHWLALPLESLLADHAPQPARPPLISATAEKRKRTT